jgi:hypothetical protein
MTGPVSPASSELPQPSPGHQSTLWGGYPRCACTTTTTTETLSALTAIGSTYNVTRPVTFTQFNFRRNHVWYVYTYVLKLGLITEVPLSILLTKYLEYRYLYCNNIYYQYTSVGPITKQHRNQKQNQLFIPKEATRSLLHVKNLQ